MTILLIILGVAFMVWFSKRSNEWMHKNLGESEKPEVEK